MERTFKILVIAEHKVVSFPCRGSGPLNGSDALKIMASYKRKNARLGGKVRVLAITDNDAMEDGIETLTYKEMSAIYGK